jgi:hypothetical protein
MKFFNKIRYEMLKGKKLRNYLVYAVGEIILVVIGILIALWINNWNKGKEVANSNKILQEKVLDQLDKDINKIQNFRKDLDTLNNVYLKALGKNYDKIKVKQAALIPTILYEVYDLGLDKQNMKWIDNAQLDNSKASEHLINISDDYKLYFKNIDDLEHIIYKKISSNLEFLEATKPWYAELITDFKCNDDCVRYLLYSEEYKAKIASLRFLYINQYADLMKGYYYDLNRAKTKLENLLKG